MIRSISYPAVLERIERAAQREIDLDDLYARREALKARRAKAEAAMKAAERCGDDGAYDRAAAEHDACSDELGPIGREIFDLEQSGPPEFAGLEAVYYAIKL